MPRACGLRCPVARSTRTSAPSPRTKLSRPRLLISSPLRGSKAARSCRNGCVLPPPVSAAACNILGRVPAATSGRAQETSSDPRTRHDLVRWHAPARILRAHIGMKQDLQFRQVATRGHQYRVRSPATSSHFHGCIFRGSPQGWCAASASGRGARRSWQIRSPRSSPSVSVLDTWSCLSTPGSWSGGRGRPDGAGPSLSVCFDPREPLTREARR